MARESAFNANFGQEDPTSKELEGRDRSRRRKRAGTTSIEESSAKKLRNSYQACGRRGYTLLDYQTLFKNKRLDSFKPSKALLKKVKDNLARDKDLAAKVEKIRLQEQDDINKA